MSFAIFFFTSFCWRGITSSNHANNQFLVRDADSESDGNQEMTIVFAAGNSGSGSNTVGSPGTAKNIITVGASENVHPFGGACFLGFIFPGLALT